jgi:hypothetical protein
MAVQRLLRQHQRILHGVAMDHQRTRGMITSSHQESLNLSEFVDG